MFTSSENASTKRNSQTSANLFSPLHFSPLHNVSNSNSGQTLTAVNTHTSYQAKPNHNEMPLLKRQQLKPDAETSNKENVHEQLKLNASNVAYEKTQPSVDIGREKKKRIRKKKLKNTTIVKALEPFTFKTPVPDMDTDAKCASNGVIQCPERVLDTSIECMLNGVFERVHKVAQVENIINMAEDTVKTNEGLSAKSETASINKSLSNTFHDKNNISVNKVRINENKELENKKTCTDVSNNMTAIRQVTTSSTDKVDSSTSVVDSKRRNAEDSLCPTEIPKQKRRKRKKGFQEEPSACLNIQMSSEQVSVDANVEIGDETSEVQKREKKKLKLSSKKQRNARSEKTNDISQELENKNIQLRYCAVAEVSGISETDFESSVLTETKRKKKKKGKERPEEEIESIEQENNEDVAVWNRVIELREYGD